MSRSHGFFITGTDTGIGKTQVALALMRTLKKHGYEVVGMKPVASGCQATSVGLRNRDALMLQAESSWRFPYETINLYAFEPSIAPHLAARQVGIEIELSAITEVAQQLHESGVVLVVEGVGGWQVPLNDRQMLPDLAKALRLPVILVVGVRLGCLNHALLSAASIEDSEIEFAGWIANQIEPDVDEFDPLVETLKAKIEAPCIGVLGYSTGAQEKELEIMNLASFRSDALVQSVKENNYG